MFRGHATERVISTGKVINFRGGRFFIKSLVSYRSHWTPVFSRAGREEKPGEWDWEGLEHRPA